MTDAAMRADLSDVARLVVPDVRRRLPRVAQLITGAIRTAVPGYAHGERRHQLIFTAVNSAVAHFLDRAVGLPVSPLAVDDLFRKMGFREAGVGDDLSHLESAIRGGAGACWAEIRVAAAARKVTTSALEDLHEALDAYADHLLAQVHRGHAAGAAAREQDPGLARRRLVDGLLGGAKPEAITAYSQVAGFSVPPQLVVIAVELPEDAQFDASALPPSVLHRPGTGRATLLTHEGLTAEAVDIVTAQVPEARFAVGWQVDTRDLPSAYRWAQRALVLMENGVLPARQVIDCREHRTAIWLHAEPTMRRQLAQELLQPLFEETANSREILSETLLVWLETRDSAPAIAARLGVHPQTVRYRWRRINQLFGESLHDPEFVVQLTLVLKASVSLWIAGDQSDFERYQERTQ